MKKNNLLALAISAISAGILISCAKPAEEKKISNQDLSPESNASIKPVSEEQVVASEMAVIDKIMNEDLSEDELLEGEKEVTLADIEEPKVIAHYFEEKAQDFLAHVATDIIVPTYETVVVKSKGLQALSRKSCLEGQVSEKSLLKLREEWLAVAQAWAQAEAINFGSATDDMNNLYINYFPDERDLLNRSIKQLLKDSPNITPEEFVDQSAIVQGVPALEDLLYTNDTLDKAQCAFLLSASIELTRRLSLINNDWQQNSQQLLNTKDATAGLNQWYNSLLSFVETLKSTGIAKPLGLGSHPKGHLPAYKAKQSNAIISAKLAMLEKSLLDEKLLDIYKPKEGVNSAADNELAMTLSKVTATIQKTTKLLKSMPADIAKANVKQQVALYDNLTVLTKQMKRELMPALGIQIGFNSTDGD